MFISDRTLSPRKIRHTFGFFSLESESESRSVVSHSLRPRGLYNPWDSPGQNTGVGSISLLQRIFPTQGPNPGLPHCWRILYQLSHKGSPRILEWVAYPCSSGYSWPRNRTRVSSIAGRFFYQLSYQGSLIFFLERAINSLLSSVDLQGHTTTPRGQKHVIEF